MKITTAIILAGGLGTRLQPVLQALPKCMAPVNNIPFIDYVIAYLKEHGIDKFILALGYQSNLVINYFESNYATLDVIFSVEKTALGTGGAIKQALDLTNDEHIIIVNGDTLFKADIQHAMAAHTTNNAACTIILKPMEHYNRFGTVVLNEQQQVIAFTEKQPMAHGLINGGIYILSKAQWQQALWPDTFSFEKEYLEKKVPEKSIFGVIDYGYFIDIGIPEDYVKFQMDCQ